MWTQWSMLFVFPLLKISELNTTHGARNWCFCCFLFEYPPVLQAKLDIITDILLFLKSKSVQRSREIKTLCLSWQVHVPVQVAESGIPPVYSCTAHYVEMLLKAEVPLVHSAFRISGFTPSQVWSVEKGDEFRTTDIFCICLILIHKKSKSTETYSGVKQKFLHSPTRSQFKF